MLAALGGIAAGNVFDFQTPAYAIGARRLALKTLNFSGQVLYDARACLAQSGPEAPLPSARLELFGVDGVRKK